MIMSDKKTQQYSLFVILFFALVLGGWFFSDESYSKQILKETNTPTEPQSKIVEKKATVKEAPIQANQTKVEETGEIQQVEAAEHRVTVGSSRLLNSYFDKAEQLSEQQALRNTVKNYDFVMANDKIGPQTRVKTDYYMLALSWSPGFCQNIKQKNNGVIPESLQYQCDSNNNFGWVIHGLWPQSKKARNASGHPRFCQGDLPEVDADTIIQYLPTSPGAALLQGEWEKHGACAFQRAEDYFAKQQTLFQTLKLPRVNMNKRELFKWMKLNNRQLAGKTLGAGRNELYICYDLQWQVINCPRT